jgi:phosphonate transport system substrate-binding protein
MEVLPGSTSGALVQMSALRRATGRRLRFRSVGRAGTHEGALGSLLSGKADIAALAEVPWRALQTSDPAAAAQLVQLWRSDPLPPGPIVCVKRAAVPCDRIGARLLAGDERSRAVARALAEGWSETKGALSFKQVTPAAFVAFSSELGRE